MNYVLLTKTVCNCRFYEGENGLKDNAVSVENLSGRKVSYLANERFIETKNLKLTLENSSANPEYSRFKRWYKETLGGIAGYFKCDELGESVWRFTENPAEDSGQKYKTLTIKLEEAY